MLQGANEVACEQVRFSRRTFARSTLICHPFPCKCGHVFSFSCNRVLIVAAVGPVAMESTVAAADAELNLNHLRRTMWKECYHCWNNNCHCCSGCYLMNNNLNNIHWRRWKPLEFHDLSVVVDLNTLTKH